MSTPVAPHVRTQLSYALMAASNALTLFPLYSEPYFERQQRPESLMRTLDKSIPPLVLWGLLTISDAMARVHRPKRADITNNTEETPYK